MLQTNKAVYSAGERTTGLTSMGSAPSSSWPSSLIISAYPITAISSSALPRPFAAIVGRRAASARTRREPGCCRLHRAVRRSRLGRIDRSHRRTGFRGRRSVRMWTVRVLLVPSKPPIDGVQTCLHGRAYRVFEVVISVDRRSETANPGAPHRRSERLVAYAHHSTFRRQHPRPSQPVCGRDASGIPRGSRRATDLST